jgi:hypothetical protein
MNQYAKNFCLLEPIGGTEHLIKKLAGIFISDDLFYSAGG